MSDYAKGLEGVTANESVLSNVEGLDGRLSYLGYHIDDLVENCCYEEVVYLLHHRKLPTQAELDSFKRDLASRRAIPQGVIDFLQAAPRDAGPMDVLRTAVSMLGLYDRRAKIGEPDHEANREVAMSLCAQVGTIVAYYHRARQGLDLPPVREDLSEAGHFIYLSTGTEPGEQATKTLDIAYTLHADHGMNASTFACRVVASTGARPVSAALAGLSALSGPLHGGAPGPVLDMLDELRDVSDKVGHLRAKLASGERLMGFGHRVYRTRDPRAAVLKEAVARLGTSSYLDHAEEVERAALETLAAHKPGRSLQTNVEFYTSVLLQEVGFQREWFTPLFATGRILGWMAHYREQRAGGRLIRPKATYIGPMP